MSKLKISLVDSKVKIHETKRGTMKVSFKLSKDEAEAFKSFMDMVKPDQITQEDFMKQMFFEGIRGIEGKLQKMLQENMGKLQEQKNQAEATKTSITQETPNAS